MIAVDWPSWINASSAIAMVAVTIALFVIARHQLVSQRRIERAYIHVKGHNPDMLVSGNSGLAPSENGPRLVHQAMTTVVISNAGSTPAYVERAHLEVTVLDRASRPSAPQYAATEGEPEELFLPQGEAFTKAWMFPIAVGDIAACKKGQKVALTLGFVDYRDAFGQSHRRGFAFQCTFQKEHARPEQPIGPVTDPRSYLLELGSFPGWNYDRKR